jgi:UDP-GlcNAc:undecaprenyl-phosphate/decaprenyl-phosphate GlcNAc-1-phosphate transferase
MYDIILAFITAFFVTYYAIPSIIQISKIKHLMDKPGERSSHAAAIPTLGGFGIFAGLICSVMYWTPFSVFSGLQYILCSLILITLVGVKDDMVPLTPSKKLLGQVLAAAILAIKADVRITDFHGVFGIHDIPYWFSVIFSIFTIIVINNSFNLIDGINGLAGSISCVVCVTFGLWFYSVDQIALAVVSAALAGATVGFLKYNFTPARIFMGDTGSLIIGLVASILAIKFIELNITLDKAVTIKSVPAVAVGIMIIPLFDTLRVFTRRILAGKSPFSPDKTHIHHILLDLGFSHMQGTTTLVFVNIFYVYFVFKMQWLGSLELLLLLLFMSVVASQTLFYYAERRKKRIALEQ